jgi:hypothetical protein
MCSELIPYYPHSQRLPVALSVAQVIIAEDHKIHFPGVKT